MLSLHLNTKDTEKKSYEVGWSRKMAVFVLLHVVVK